MYHKTLQKLTLFAQKRPQALQRDLGPDGPRRIIGVDFELIPQCVHLVKHVENKNGQNFDVKIHLMVRRKRNISKNNVNLKVAK